MLRRPAYAPFDAEKQRLERGGYAVGIWAAKLAAVRRTLQEYPALQDLSVAGVKVPAGGTNRAD